MTVYLPPNLVGLKMSDCTVVAYASLKSQSCPILLFAKAIKRTARGDRRVLGGGEGIAAESLEEMDCQSQL